MDLEKLIEGLRKNGLLDPENFNPRFTERIMREGGVATLENQDADIATNIVASKTKIEEAIREYSPEKVEAYFVLQELANYARSLFYGFNGSNGEEGKHRFSEKDRARLMDRLSQLKPGSYTSGDIGEPFGISSTSVGGFLSHLSTEERERLNIRYIGGKKGWEKYE